MPARREKEPALEELPPMLLVPALDLRQLLLEEPAVHGHEARLGVAAREARLQTSDELQPVIVRIVQAVPEGRHGRFHRERHEDVGGAAGLDAGKVTPGHADDGQQVTVGQNGLVEDRRVAAETASPIAEGEDRDRVAAGHAVVVGQEHAPERRRHAEEGEVVAGDELARRALGLSARSRG